ncbi:bis(5'-nucleosyl)-tetraphosphatase (symmetrical) YqeK [Aciduricibacillus chroicocephali]|uniref:bis(5'-nucleosyl)-tetraphosphatase (symmetrical) n=1 Tax=Aciduricibacillus chroicocephali TaxID=3054939 RepID=A0ABY9KRU3_9BACI|nr:bis(5'-nucleosyl)-tetraphosphatase (symmetrical) YqeK [Bacillaceae bacterium 44XB]
MRVEQAKEIIKPLMTEKRFDHTLRVAETAVELASIFGENQARAELAALLHDYAKCMDLSLLKRWIETSNLPKDLLLHHHELWHGPVGALMIRQNHGINDTEILNAVHYHTTGRPHMSRLEMIIFLADYIEPGRNFPGLEEVREVAREDLVKGCWLASGRTIRYLMDKQSAIYPESFQAYNDLTLKIHGGM